MLADINGNLADLRSEAAMASQRFCLRWNNHQSNLLSVFDQLLHDEAFVDVTLAVEGQLLKAHKMVLSACSPYFQALFVNHPDKHPIVILKDVPYADMRSLLDFMYRGEVSVDQDRLTAFLRVAESLRIKGLTEVNEDKCDLPSITSSLLGNQNTVPPPPPNLHRINQLGQHHHMPQKRYHHMSSHPLLGSALTAPKRKRGRPRKLSGSSDTPMDTSSLANQEQQCSDLVQGSPEMMEMKMGLDFQSEIAQNSNAASSTGSNASNNNNNNNNQSAAKRDQEPTENGTEATDSLLLRIKSENEPTPGTSGQAKDESFTRPHSRQGSESFKQGSLPSLPSDITFEICGSPTTPEQPNHLGQQPSQAAADYAEDYEDSDSNSTNASNQPASEDTTATTTTGSSKKQQQQQQQPTSSSPASSEGVHFLTDERPELLLLRPKSSEAEGPSEPEVRKQLLEYLIQKDGSVVCKWCGEVLPSRTRWYRHKYKLHVAPQHQQQQQQQSNLQVNPLSTLTSTSSAATASTTTTVIAAAGQHQPPAPLFKCQSCNAYFKSRKGYIGHLSARHSADDPENDENREEQPNGRTPASKNSAGLPSSRKPADMGKGPNWEEQREKEEKLVADIIDRVKRECEAQGEAVTRRGYSRRSTVMNSGS